MLNNSKEKSKVLKARARALARGAAGSEGDQEYVEVVEFMLAHERYALELTHIREVYPLKDLTPLPGTPDFVLGIINIRGQILSII
ncbi:MAG: chemotaxis protein CheW, partial [Deltaproteobacteria bacterium]|nr:chemotaxis protein CheW [Deltaproteobacteria bacterium]